MKDKEYELGDYYIYIPDGAKLNCDNKKDTPPKTKYQSQEKQIDEKTLKTLCGGNYDPNKK